jgi:hypothetical protein
MEPVDESATGSANFFGPVRSPAPVYDRRVHLRAPSVAAGVSAFLWALLMAVCVWAFMVGIGISNAMAVIVGLLTLGAGFLFIRTRGAQGRLRDR